jgi:sugar/nucleoside kinase (ribokinase family)
MEMKKGGVFGSVVMDVLVRSNNFAVMKSHNVKGGIALCEVYGGKTEVEEIVMTSGGGATNVAVGLRKLGLLTRPIGSIGDDMCGDQILEELKSYGVDTDWIESYTELTTSVSTVLIAGDGGRSIMTYRPDHRNWKGMDYRMYEQADFWVISGSADKNVDVSHVIKLAYEKRIACFWNPGKPDLIESESTIELMKICKLVCLNKMEACQLLSLSMDEVTSRDVVKKFFELGVRSVVVTDGARGVVGLSDGMYVEMKALRSKSIDDTGAGDSFFCGVIAGMLSNQELVNSLKWGVINASSVIKYMGAKKGLLSQSEMKKHMTKSFVCTEEVW